MRFYPGGRSGESDRGEGRWGGQTRCSGWFPSSMQPRSEPPPAGRWPSDAVRDHAPRDTNRRSPSWISKCAVYVRATGRVCSWPAPLRFPVLEIAVRVEALTFPAATLAVTLCCWPTKQRCCLHVQLGMSPKNSERSSNRSGLDQFSLAYKTSQSTHK